METASVEQEEADTRVNPMTWTGQRNVFNKAELENLI